MEPIKNLLLFFDAKLQLIFSRSKISIRDLVFWLLGFRSSEFLPRLVRHASGSCLSWFRYRYVFPFSTLFFNCSNSGIAWSSATYFVTVLATDHDFASDDLFSVFTGVVQFSSIAGNLAAVGIVKKFLQDPRYKF